jgi:hypothetical protein
LKYGISADRSKDKILQYDITIVSAMKPPPPVPNVIHLLRMDRFNVVTGRLYDRGYCYLFPLWQLTVYGYTHQSIRLRRASQFFPWPDWQCSLSLKWTFRPRPTIHIQAVGV